MMTRNASILAAALALTGCYVNTPVVSGVAPAPESRIVLDLTDAGTVAVGSQLGPGVGKLEGRLVRFAEDSIALRLERTIARNGIPADWYNTPVTVGREHVGLVSIRKLDGRRTLVAVGASVLAGITIFKGFEAIGLAGESPEDPGGPGNPGIRLP